MKLRAIALGLAVLTASGSSMAGMVNASSNLSVLAVDGQKASKSLLKNTTSFNAEAGQTHQAVVRLSEVLGSANNQELFESSPIIVTFQGNSQDLQITAPTIRSKDDAEKFNKAPSITVTTKSGQAVDAKVDVLKQEGLFPTANVVSDLAEYNASNAPAAVAAFAAGNAAAMPGVASTKASKGKIVVQGENVAEHQLQYWFQQADKETQTRFLNWAKKQK